jgi:Fic/DOC family
VTRASIHCSPPAPCLYNSRVSEPTLRLQASAARKQRRLDELLGGRSANAPELLDVVCDAQALGSLELAGFRFAWEEVRAARRGAAAPAEILGLQRAQRAVPPQADLSVAALRAWRSALDGGPAELRDGPGARSAGPEPAPPEFVLERLSVLEQWLGAKSGRELRAEQQGALALARIVEILPFDDGNGRVARLAASHLMVRAGARPPILVGADRARLEACLQSAFRLDTGPLTALLAEASERSLDVLVQVLEREAAEPRT